MLSGTAKPLEAGNVYVLFTAVEYNAETTEDQALETLKERLVPLIRHARGFVRGMWFGDDRRGHILIVFETEEQARRGLQKAGDEFQDVTVTSSNVYRLQLEASGAG